MHGKVLVGNSKCQRPFGRPGLGWEGNIKVDFDIQRTVNRDIFL